MSGLGLVKVATPTEVTKLKVQEQAAGQPINQQPVIDNLTSYVRSCWERARDHKVSSGNVERLLRCDRQRKGEYDPEKLQEIRKVGGSEIYMMLTDIKCRAAESWIKDVMNAYGSDTWLLEPTAEPSLTEDLRQAVIEGVAHEAMAAHQQGVTNPNPLVFKERLEEMTKEVKLKLVEEAGERAEAMTLHIRDQLQDGNWPKAMNEFYSDFTTYPSAFVKGPVVRRKKALKWDKNNKPVVTNEVKRVFYRMSPYDAFPSPEATSIQDGYFCERVRFSLRDLSNVKGVESYRDDQIEAVIEEFGRGGLRSWLYGDTEKAILDGRGPLVAWVNPNEMVDGVEYWGQASGKMLKEWGLKNVKDFESYDVTIILIGNHVIRATINPDPLGQRPYMKACFEEVPGAFWGLAIPEMMRDNQLMCNAAARALANNVAIASGPMVEVTIDRLPDGERVTNIYPWKLFQTTSDKTGGGQPAIRFYQPNLHAQELLQIFQHFSRQADEVTGIPNYVYGSGQAGGAGRTASGLSMLMDNASKGIKQAIGNIDVAVSYVIECMYSHNMLYDSDETIKGDMQIVVKGALGMIQREGLQEKRQAFLAATMNPLDSQIMGVEGRAYLLGEVAKTLQLDTRKIVPPPEVLQQRKEQLQQQQAQQMAAQQATPTERIALNRGGDGSVHSADILPGAGPQQQLHEEAPISTGV